MSESPQVAPLPGLLKLSVDDIALVACEAAMLVDGSQTIVAANSAAERLLRHAPGSLQGQALSTLLPRAVRSTHDQLVRRFAESASPEARMADRTSVVALRGDASEIALDIYLWRMDVPVEGRPHRLYLVLMRDPSIEPTLRRQVAALNQRFRPVLDMAPVAICVAEAAESTARPSSM